MNPTPTRTEFEAAAYRYARELDEAFAAAMGWPTVPCTSNHEVQRLRAGLEDVLAYVRGKDDLYANGALRQIAEDALGDNDRPTAPEVKP